MVGAPLLAARAALRTGAGLVTIASTTAVIEKLEKRVEEVMTLRLPEDNSQATGVIAEFIHKRQVSALVIGPGLAADRAGMVKSLVAKAQLPVVLDAGGLAAYNHELPELTAAARHNSAIVLTPHAGEFARLTGEPLPDDEAAARRAALATAQATGTTIVLKGHHSLVAGADGWTYINTTGNPGLATAGTGDVLSGIIGGLLAQQYSGFEAASAGVYLHGLAGDLAAAQTTEPGLIASDLIEFLPAALRKIKTTLT